MKWLLVLALISAAARAGVSYELAIRPVDESALTRPSPAVQPYGPVVVQYVVDGTDVRVGGPHAKTVYFFKDRIMTVVDHTSRVVHVLKFATLEQVRSHYAETVAKLAQAAGAAPPAEREAAERKAADMKAASDRLTQSVARDFKMTTRFESVDGRACRIWEETESGAKRLELCVAPAASVPGGADILVGFETLSRFRQGSDFALGVDFGLSNWWHDIAGLSGIPLLIREYKYDSPVTEILLTAMRTGVARDGEFDLPPDYRTEEGPDYAQWYVH